jgi:hypothetical protein
MESIKALFAGHGIAGLIALWILREVWPSLWKWVSTTGTDGAVLKGLAALKKLLKTHGATDAELADVEGKIVAVLARVEGDVQADASGTPARP